MKTEKWAKLIDSEKYDRVNAVAEEDEWIKSLMYNQGDIDFTRDRLLADPAYADEFGFAQGDEDAAQDIAEFLCHVVNWRDCYYEKRHLWATVLTEDADYEDVAWNVQCDIENSCDHYANHYILRMPDALVRIDDADLESVARDIAKLVGGDNDDSVFIIRDREAGNYITDCHTREEAEAELRAFVERDIADGVDPDTAADYYEIVKGYVNPDKFGDYEVKDC